MNSKKAQLNPIAARIAGFESSYWPITTETVAELKNGYSDEEFWGVDALKDNIENDITFGMKLWTGFHGLLEIIKNKSANCLGDETLAGEFNDLFVVVLRYDLSINIEARIAAILQTKEIFLYALQREEYLNSSDIMKLAYITETETMEAMGLDTKQNPPFTIGLRLNHEHSMVQMVQKIIQEEKTKKLN